MACGTCAERTTAQAKQRIGSPQTAGSVVNTPARCPHCGWFMAVTVGCRNPRCETSNARCENAASNALAATVAAINWRKARLLSGGGYAVIFRVAPGVVAKVGLIEPVEAERQRWAAAHGWALPVLDYEENAELPYNVTRRACPVHGARRNYLDADEELCLCGEALGVLVMPEAQEVTDPADLATGTALQTQVAVAQTQRWPGSCLDDRPANVMRWQGQVRLIDFGEPEM